MMYGNQKINPIGGLTVDYSQLTFVPTSKSRDTKTIPNIVIGYLLHHICHLQWQLASYHGFL